MYKTKLTKEDKAMLADEFRKVWRKRDGSADENMVDWCVKQASAYIVIAGRIVVVNKPKISREFCYGYGLQSGCDYDEAHELAEAARSNESWFVERNMDGTWANEVMEYVTGEQWVFEPWLDPTHYTNQPLDCKLCEIRWEHWHKRDWCRGQGWRPFTDDELVELYGLAYEEQAKFLKRLKTYLKRYGMSKVRTWTYWADE